jgi:hypothetical protein
MSIDQDDDNIDDTADIGAPALDRVTAAIAFVDFAADLYDLAANHKAYKARLTKLRRLERDIAAAEQKLAALTARTEQTEAALAEREAELAARDAEIERRESSFEVSLAEARDHLRAYYDSLADTDRRIRYRILSSADLLHGFNERLQDLPSWQQIKQLVPNLPDDLPAAPPVEVVSENVREDWAGSVFTPGSSLTRTVRGAA